MSKYFLSLLLLVIYPYTKTCFCQDKFDEFRALENHVKHSNPDSLIFFSQTLDTTNTLENALRYWSKGKAAYWQSNYPKAYIELEKALKIIKETDNPVLLAEVYLDLSNSLAVVDKTGKALSYLLEANAIFREHGNNEQRSRSAISLGEMYRKLGEYDSALKVLRETLNYSEDNLYNHARCLNRMAAVFSETSKLDSSLNYSYRSLELASTIGDADLIATSENEIGFVLRNQNKHEKSLPHFFKADSLWRSVGMDGYATNPIHHAAVVYRYLGELEKGLEITREAYSRIKGKGWYQIEMNLCDDLKMFHHRLNNKDSSLFYDRERLEAAYSYKKNVYEVNNKMVEALYTQKENEQTIKEQKVSLQNELREKLAINRERGYLLLTITLIGLILLIIFFYAYKQQRLKKSLFLENQEKESKNQQLSQALVANEALVQEISHRVKNNLAVLSGLLTMQANRSGNEKVIKELKDSVLRIESIATIHKKLYDKRSDAQVNLREAILELINNVLSAMGVDPTTCLETEIDICEIDIAEAVTLCLILNEVITNSCKYANLSEESKLIVKLKNGKDKITCNVIDHGEGFDEAIDTAKSKSLGLYLIKLLAKQLGAVVSWEKKREEFIFRIELKKDE